MNDLDSISSGQTFNASVDRPPTHASLASPRIVNYETGKAGAKARSLWRLEPLRIRWVEFLLSIPWLCVLLLSFFFISIILPLSIPPVSSFFLFPPSPYQWFNAALWHFCLYIPPSLFLFPSVPLSFWSWPNSQGGSLLCFHCPCCVKTNICHICRVFDPTFLNRNKVNN